jgi:hypothetical protein
MPTDADEEFDEATRKNRAEFVSSFVDDFVHERTGRNLDERERAIVEGLARAMVELP